MLCLKKLNNQLVENELNITKPVFLGDDDLELTPRTMLAAHIKPPKKTPRFTAKDLTPELAAKHLQGAWRSKVARRRLRVMVRNQYKKKCERSTTKKLSKPCY